MKTAMKKAADLGTIDDGSPDTCKLVNLQVEQRNGMCSPSIAACKLTAYQDGEVYLPTQ